METKVERGVVGPDFSSDPSHHHVDFGILFGQFTEQGSVHLPTQFVLELDFFLLIVLIFALPIGFQGIAHQNGLYLVSPGVAPLRRRRRRKTTTFTVEN